jgi:hypothetical protein
MAVLRAVNNNRCTSIISLLTRILTKKLLMLGKAIVDNIATIAIATMASISVKPCLCRIEAIEEVKVLKV